jgi:hypothetical protein
VTTEAGSRVTVNGVRVEINKDNVVRTYRRYNPTDNSERRQDTFSVWDLASLAAAATEARLRLRGE